MERAQRIAFISYCDKLGLGNRILLGVRASCEHRRLTDSLSRYILKTRSPFWTQPEEVLRSEALEVVENLMDSDVVNTSAQQDNIQDDNIPPTRSKLSWEPRSVNLLEAKYEPFTLFVINAPLTTAEATALLPSLYNYFVANCVSKVVVITSLNLRPSELVPLAALTVGEHHIRSHLRTSLSSAAASVVSSATDHTSMQLCEVLFNNCPTFGLPSLHPGDWLTGDPFLIVMSQMFTFSRLAGAILGTLTLSKDDAIVDHRWQGFGDCAWRITAAIQQCTGVSFDLDVVECMQCKSADDASAKNCATNVYL